jgi:hypothetical protein
MLCLAGRRSGQRLFPGRWLTSFQMLGIPWWSGANCPNLRCNPGHSARRETRRQLSAFGRVRNGFDDANAGNFLSVLQVFRQYIPHIRRPWPQPRSRRPKMRTARRVPRGTRARRGVPAAHLSCVLVPAGPMRFTSAPSTCLGSSGETGWARRTPPCGWRRRSSIGVPGQREQGRPLDVEAGAHPPRRLDDAPPASVLGRDLGHRARLNGWSATRTPTRHPLAGLRTPCRKLAKPSRLRR